MTGFSLTFTTPTFPAIWASLSSARVSPVPWPTQSWGQVLLSFSFFSSNFGDYESKVSIARMSAESLDEMARALVDEMIANTENRLITVGFVLKSPSSPLSSSPSSWSSWSQRSARCCFLREFPRLRPSSSTAPESHYLKVSWSDDVDDDRGDNW